ncbi:hypothetical protein PI125_g11312 [Phytophthora idaei]|nr:hypothetical protein PI125_g11312 [Phytophthora idaei]
MGDQYRLLDEGFRTPYDTVTGKYKSGQEAKGIWSRGGAERAGERPDDNQPTTTDRMNAKTTTEEKADLLTRLEYTWKTVT